MFALAPDASKVAFTTLLGNLVEWGFSMVDCQVYTDHLARVGAEKWSRSRFLTALHRALEAPTRQGRWTLPLAPEDALARLCSD
jgi:leucyl/phenylalanyl-tRNA--protein transferase